MIEYITKPQARDALLYLDDDLGFVPESLREKILNAWNDEIRRLPSADVAPVVHATTSNGYWDEVYCKWETCDNCHGENVYDADYCNWCGARLDGGKTDAD